MDATADEFVGQQAEPPFAVQTRSAATCPGGTTFTYNNAPQVTGKNGSTTGWTDNAASDETPGASTTARTTEGWSDFNQLCGCR